MSKKQIFFNYLWKKSKCECEKPTTSYYVAAAGCADDDAAVAALPDAWAPRHSGPVLINYLKEREENHNEILKIISDGANSINKYIDSKVRALAEALLAHIQCNQNEICCVIKKYDSGEPLTKEARDEALKQIYQLHACRVDEMADFKREASMVEKERADDLRILLRNKFQKLITVGHCTPKDLLHDFDERAYEINQQLLSNTRAYVDLVAQLRVQADENCVRARSAINQLCLGICLNFRKGSALRCPPEQQSVPRRAMSAVQDKQQISPPTDGITLTNVDKSNECVTQLVQAYKSAVISIYSDFSEKLNDLEKDLFTHRYLLNTEGHASHPVHLHQMIDKTVCLLSSSIHKKNITCREFFESAGTDMLAMTKSLSLLGEGLQNTLNTLHDAGHLWDTHILRQAQAQQLTIAAVEDLLTSNDAVELMNEITFNVALEQLRASPDEDKLQQYYDGIMGMLDRTAELYRVHSEAELGRLEEFMNLPVLLANNLIAEFNCFLEKHPRTIQSLPNESNQLSSISPNFRHISIQSLLPRTILQTELQEIALRNWVNGFLENFQNDASSIPDELKRQARLWVEERARALHMRYSLKMVSHSVRVERLRACRERRCAELRHHEARLDSHLDALYELVDNLPIEVSEFSSLDAPYLYPFCKWIASIQTSMDAMQQAQDELDSEVKRLKMCSFASRLAKHRQLFEESLNAAVEDYRRQIEYRIQNARISNVRFMSQIKLFTEDGLYSAQEATKACSALIKGADALELSVSRVMDALNHRRNYLLNAADQHMLPMQRICDDVVKTGAKGMQSKGKSPPLGKKK